MKASKKFVYQDGTFSYGCLRSVETESSEIIRDYERRGLIAFENEEYLKSDIYFEWARIEKEKTE
jgi:hypothetical protein